MNPNQEPVAEHSIFAIYCCSSCKALLVRGSYTSAMLRWCSAIFSVGVSLFLQFDTLLFDVIWLPFGH